MTPSPHDPLATYTARKSARETRVAQLDRLDDRYANARLGLFVTALAVAAAGWWTDAFHPYWGAVPLAAFLGVVVAHDRVLRAKRDGERAVAYYRECLARVKGKWAGRGVSGEGLIDEHHLFAADLDLVGHGSLFERLCTARTRAGEVSLMGYLTRPAPAELARERQEAVRELAPMLDLREGLAVLGESVRASVHPATLQAWANGPDDTRLGRWRAPALGLAAGSLAALVWWLAFGGPMAIFLLVFAVELIALRRLHETLEDITQRLDGPARELKVLGLVLRRLEEESFTSESLRRFQGRLKVGETPASSALLRLHNLVGRMEQQRNAFFAPLGIVLMWPVHCALALEAWRAQYRHAIGRWLEALGDLESLNGLAAFAYDHPEYPFPTLREGAAAGFDGKAVGHPLLPAEGRVCNDVRLDEACRVLIVSGSNMSGKSTLLRTVGVNTVLAMAGAPVCAERLDVSPFAIGATLRIHDSIQEGRSRFYAEITRLKEIVDLTKGEWPVLFLIDEILNGTNSHDRLIGGAAIVETLVKAEAFGFVTTHDLALTKSTDRLGAAVRNVHFEDHMDEGRLAFDYTMRDGVVTKSNALALMRTVGLDV